MFTVPIKRSVFIMLAVLLLEATAVASAVTTDRPYLVDETCAPREYDSEWHGEAVYVTGHHGWCSSPPGGPVSCGEEGLLGEDLSIVRVGCEPAERGSWVLGAGRYLRRRAALPLRWSAVDESQLRGSLWKRDWTTQRRR